MVFFNANRKTASLGEMIQTLTPLGVAVPGGFAVTASAYDAVLDRFQLRERLKLLLEGVDGKLVRCRETTELNLLSNTLLLYQSPILTILVIVAFRLAR
jgi:phosphoenolpyruvate synthase/pyruvate phosphate dikinase